MKIKNFTITNWFNSKYHGVPQNRERVYTVGHLRRYGRCKVFPISGTAGEDSAEIKQIGQQKAKRNNPNRYRCYDQTGIAPTLGCMEGGGLEPHTAIPMFGIDYNTLTAQDRHGVAISEVNGVPVIWYDKYKCYIAIRKLTPKECFRLQGWTDDYFEKAQFVNSDSQLYKQAGNGVSVPVVEDIAKSLGGDTCETI